MNILRPAEETWFYQGNFELIFTMLLLLLLLMLNACISVVRYNLL